MRSFWERQTKTLTLNSIVMVLSNVVFNYILIFGKFGVPQLGIAGAAIGSSLAELVSLIFFIPYTRHCIDIRKYGLDKIPGIRWNILKRMLNVSFWTMVQNFRFHVVPALPLRRASGRTFAGRYQHHPQRIGHNVHGYDGIRFNLRIVCQQPYRSRTHRLRAPGTIRQHIRIAYAFVLPLAVYFALCPKLILSVYTDMPELQEAAVPSLLYFAPPICSSYPPTSISSPYRGTGNTRTALALEMITLVVYTCYITYIVAYLKLDVAFAWTSEIVYSVGILVLCYFYMKKGKWSLKKI